MGTGFKGMNLWSEVKLLAEISSKGKVFLCSKRLAMTLKMFK
jgi:hypothetical protein